MAPKRIKLTIGMAIYDSYNDFWFTCQALLMYHDLSECELMVVDNKPGSPSSADMKSRLDHYFNKRCAKSTYIEAAQVTGTSFPRDLIFRRASGENVICIDSHVLLVPGAIQKLIKWYDDHPGTNDLIQGPIILDNQTSFHTQFRDFWRGEMWGIWGNIWENREGTLRFSVDEREGKCIYMTTGMREEEITNCGLPEKLQFAGHENILKSYGYRLLGELDQDEFEIPGQGLGLFSCRRNAWPGFNPEFRGFGGEEMYIHEKFRQRGDKTLCLGFLRWLHKFSRAGDINYPATRWNKVRNYVLGHLELGLPLDRVHKHFIETGLLTEDDWEHLIKDPVKHLDYPGNAMMKSGNQKGIPKFPLETVFDRIKPVDRDMNQHMDTLAELASKCNHVTEFSIRKESTVALAKGNPDTLISHNREGRILGEISDSKEGWVHDDRDPLSFSAIEDTDLLFLNTVHTAERVREELARFGNSAKRYIVIHNTVTFSIRGEGGVPGIVPPIVAFIQSNPDWFIAAHYEHQHGLTVLSRNTEDRPDRTIYLLPPGFGPGTELTAVLKDVFGIESAPTCDCKAKANQMDIWGVKGCEEKFETIVGWIRDNYERWGWGKLADELSPDGPTRTIGKGKVIWNFLKSGMLKNTVLHGPFEALVRECIHRAKEKEDQKTVQITL